MTTYLSYLAIGDLSLLRLQGTRTLVGAAAGLLPVPSHEVIALTPTSLHALLADKTVGGHIRTVAAYWGAVTIELILVTATVLRDVCAKKGNNGKISFVFILMNNFHEYEMLPSRWRYWTSVR